MSARNSSRSSCDRQAQCKGGQSLQNRSQLSRPRVSNLYASLQHLSLLHLLGTRLMTQCKTTCLLACSFPIPLPHTQRCSQAERQRLANTLAKVSAFPLPCRDLISSSQTRQRANTSAARSVDSRPLISS